MCPIWILCPNMIHNYSVVFSERYRKKSYCKAFEILSSNTISMFLFLKILCIFVRVVPIVSAKHVTVTPFNRIICLMCCPICNSSCRICFDSIKNSVESNLAWLSGISTPQHIQQVAPRRNTRQFDNLSLICISSIRRLIGNFESQG